MTQLVKISANYTEINPILWEFMEESIYSSLKDSGVCSIGHKKKASNLTIMVSFIQPGGDRERAFRIMSSLSKASQIAALPSEDLKSFAYTSDLEYEWKWQRFCSLLLAKCFLLTLLKVNENKLEEEKEAKIITKWDAELIELTASRYVVLFNLIKKEFNYLRKSLPTNLTSQKPWDIFIEICREEIDAPFIARTESYQEFLIDKVLPLWEELIKIDPSRNNFQCLLQNQYLFNSELLIAVIKSLIEKAKRDNLLAASLEDYFLKCRAIGYSMVEALKARDSSGKIARSEQWINGERSIYSKNRLIKPGDEL